MAEIVPFGKSLTGGESAPAQAGDKLVDEGGNQLGNQLVSVNNQTSGTSITRSIPGGTLNADNQILEFEAWVATSDTGDNISVTFGGTIYSEDQGTEVSLYCVKGTILRTGSLAQTCFVGVFGENNWPGTRTATSVNLANAQNLTVAVEAGVGAVVYALFVKKRQAP